MTILNAEQLFEQKIDPILWVLTSAAAGRSGGLIATFISKASLVPELPRIGAGIAKHHHTWELIERSQAFALHLFTERQLDWVTRFGLHSGRDVEKLSGLEIQTSATGSPILSEALAWLDCRVEASLDTGDRTFYLAQVVEASPIRAGKPLTVQQAFSQLSAEQLDQMQQLLKRDREVDAQAIEQWRASR